MFLLFTPHTYDREWITSILIALDSVHEGAKFIVNNGRVFNSIDSLEHCCNVACVSLFYRYYNRFCSSEIRGLIPENHVFLHNKCCQYPPLQFLWPKAVQYGALTITIDCNGFSVLIFKEKWPNYASGPKSATNSDSFWVRRLFNVCVRIFCVRNATILLVYIPAKIKMSFIWKDVLLFLLKSASSVSRSQAHFPALFKRIHHHIRSAEG